jgi:hypothetical protein
MTMEEFIARARAFEFLDQDMLPNETDWPAFRAHPLEAFLRSSPAHRRRIWEAAEDLQNLLADCNFDTGTGQPVIDPADAIQETAVSIPD